MARPIQDDVKVGDPVYMYGSPRSYGKVIEVGEKVLYFRRIKVRWRKGDEEWLTTAGVQSLEGLVEETARKLEGHKKSLAAAAAL